MALSRDKRNLLFMVGALLAIMTFFQFMSYSLMLNAHDVNKDTSKVGNLGKRWNSTNAFRKSEHVVEVSSDKSSIALCKGALCTFFDITIDDSPAGRIVFLLDEKKRPKTTENFRALSTGERGVSSSGTKLHYKGTTFSRIVHNILVQGGDIHGGKISSEKDKESVYGMGFDHESLDEFHARGLLAMAGLKRSASEFFITLDTVAELDNQYVVFGKVVEGMDVIDKINSVKLNADSEPVSLVLISDSGQL